MMGNFLTALGATPAEDREMFERQGLNVARQPDNGASPRPDNRSGWLEGDTPDVIEDYLEGDAELRLHLWDPSTQLRYRAKRTGGAAGGQEEPRGGKAPREREPAR
jgi:biotin synthase